MRRIPVFAAVALLATIASALADEKPSRSAYHHRIVTVEPHRPGADETYRLEITRNGTGKPVWQRTFSIWIWANWNRDRTALAVFEAGRIHVWRPGPSFRTFRTKKLENGYGEGPHEVGGLQWSPDSKRLIVWQMNTQGDEILGTGDLQVLNTTNGQCHKVVSAGVSSPRWVSSTKVDFEVLHYDGLVSWYGYYRWSARHPNAHVVAKRWELGQARFLDSLIELGFRFLS